MAFEQKIAEYVFYVVYFVFLYYSVYWLIVLGSYHSPPVKERHVKSYPRVTIVIPAYNEESTVERTVRSVFALNYPQDKLQVICVNDGSKDGTRAKLTKLEREFKDRDFVVLHQRNQGKFVALNNALSHTTAPYFGCLDADSYVDPEALKILIRDFLNDDELAATMPIMKVRSTDNWLEKIQNIEYMTSIFFKKLHESRDCINVAPGPFSIFRTDVLRKVGGYRRGYMTEDLELALRLQKLHYKMRQNTLAIVYTKTPRSVGGYYRQRLRWNRGTFLNSWSYREMLFNPKYSDFGFIQLPMIAVSGAFAAVVFLVILLTRFRPWYDTMKMLVMTHFDFPTYIRNWRFETNLLLMDTFFIVIGLTMFIVMILYVYHSIKVSGERFSFRYMYSTLLYFYLYGLISSAIWFMTFVDIIFKKPEKWHR